MHDVIYAIGWITVISFGASFVARFIRDVIRMDRHNKEEKALWDETTRRIRRVERKRGLPKGSLDEHYHDLHDKLCKRRGFYKKWYEGEAGRGLFY